MGIELDFGAVLAQWPLLALGMAHTAALTVASAIMGIGAGIGCAWTRLDGPRAGRFLVFCYVEAIRNTPFIVQLYFIFFGLPVLGLRLQPEIASLLAMVVNLGAYSAEIVRAGIEATPQGQIEAGRSLALTSAQIFRSVILPPALRRVWPALSSQIIIVMLGSAVCGQISTEELSFAANLIQSRNFRAFESYIVAAALYLAMAMIMRAAFERVGPSIFGGRRG